MNHCAGAESCSDADRRLILKDKSEWLDGDCNGSSAADETSSFCQVPSSSETATSSFETKRSSIAFRESRFWLDDKLKAIEDDEEFNIEDDDSDSSIFSATENVEDSGSDDEEEEEDVDDSSSDDGNKNNKEEENENKNKPELISCPSIQEQWERLERNFVKRDQLLARISRGKNEAFVRQLRYREYLTRHRQREKLVMDQLILSKKEDKSDTFQVPHLPQQQVDECNQKRSPFHVLVDFVLYELNSTIPALLCVVLHCVAHIALYELVYYVCDEIKKQLGEFFELSSTFVNRNFYIGMLVVGTLMMRTTGDLLWWLNEKDYACVKFDYHNRYRLGFWDAKVLKYVRGNEVVRAIIFMLGYYLCYMGTYQFYLYLSKFFDEKSILLAELPSLLQKSSISTGSELTNSTCQAEIALQGKFKSHFGSSVYFFFLFFLNNNFKFLNNIQKRFRF